jgi:hypothetical protein
MEVQLAKDDSMIANIHCYMEKHSVNRKQGLEVVLWNKLCNVHPYIVRSVLKGRHDDYVSNVRVNRFLLEKNSGFCWNKVLPEKRFATCKASSSTISETTPKGGTSISVASVLCFFSSPSTSVRWREMRK